MEITEVTVSAGRTFNHPYETYSNLRPNVTIKANLAPGEDAQKAINDLQALAEKSVEDHKQGLLRSLEELHNLTERQREMTTLADQLRRNQLRIERIRKEFLQLATSTILPFTESERELFCGNTPEERHAPGCPGPAEVETSGL